MDEPTNDLDAETLELLEELLVNFDGTLLLICHDRAFLNNVVTNTLSFLENGEILENVGGYDDWLSKSNEQIKPLSEEKRTDKKKQYRENQKASRAQKLTFKETRELEELPARIESLENEQNDLYAQMADPAFYQEKGNIVDAKKRMSEIEGELSELYKRWEYLDSI